MQLHHIHPAEISRVWHLVYGFVSDGLAYAAGEYGVAELFRMLCEGEQQLVLAVDGERVVGAATINVEQFPNKRIAFITSLGGRDVLNEQGFSLLSDWAKSIGCDSVRGAVRPSMARLTRKVGFDQKYIIVERTL